MKLSLIRTNSEHPVFRSLVALLDAELAERDGAEHGFYHQYNGLAGLDRAVVARDGDQPVGCGALKVFAPGAMEVKRMYTLRAYRGRGVAGKVLQGLEAWAAAEGFSHVVLETGKRQPEAIALYEKHGYRRIPNFGPYIGVENSVCFEKQLEVKGREAEENRKTT